MQPIRTADGVGLPAIRPESVLQIAVYRKKKFDQPGADEVRTSRVHRGEVRRMTKWSQ